MFTSNELVYIQFQKTGSTHTARLLLKLFDGELSVNSKKHTAASPELIESDRTLLVTIRNPWDWWVSMWTFGTTGWGIQRHLTKRSLNRYVWPRTRFPFGLDLFREMRKDVRKWRSLYTNPGDVDAFRAWLRRMMDPRFAWDIKEGFAESGLVPRCGLMTWRYLYLCCRDVAQLRQPRTPVDADAVAEFDRTHCYIDHFLRQEALEDTLIDALGHIRTLTADEIKMIREASPVNTSKRPLNAAQYYDSETLALVAEHERFLIEKFKYTPPS